ncbi:hypothetical protein FRD01_22600 [Microvenator marinus]|uniref:Uncharacterized protein n=1 Tax=Microvenator marinus TaxID=2600177 RepID=A0A5B8Y0V4_9DELT|nr:hypothetical protein [Microvenator marinus]QED29973.1 hypothetical protein FRD01_22600 [Microvenator marinus]
MLPGVGPKLWLGGVAADYVVELAKGGGWGTRHLASGKFLPHVVAAGTKMAMGGAAPLQGLLSASNLAVGLKTLSVATKSLAVAKAGLVVGSLGLGVGLIGLGVGVATLWKVHQMQKHTKRELGEIKTSIANLENVVLAQGIETGYRLDRIEDLVYASTQQLSDLINYNSALLGVIIEQQGQLAGAIEELSKQVEIGVERILDAIANQTVRQEALDLETQLRKVYTYYEAVTNRIAIGDEAVESDLRGIVRESIELQAWLATRINTLEKGNPQRLPYFIGQVMALRQEIDARTILNEAPEAKHSTLMELRTQIADEIRALSDGPFLQVTFGNAELIAHYVYLRRSLSENLVTYVEIVDADGSTRMEPFIAEQLLHWDDGMNSLREKLSDFSLSGSNSLESEYKFPSLRSQAAWNELSGTTIGRMTVSAQAVEQVFGTKSLDQEKFETVLDFLSKEDWNSRIEAEVSYA